MIAGQAGVSRRRNAWVCRQGQRISISLNADLRGRRLCDSCPFVRGRQGSSNAAFNPPSHGIGGQSRSSAAARRIGLCALVEPNHDPVALDLHDPSGRHEAPVLLLRFRLLVAGSLRRQPAIATMSDHRQRQIQIHIETNFAGQAVDVEEVHADSQSIFHPVRIFTVSSK